MDEGELAWYALQVFHGREERLEGELASEGWEVFLPRRWSEVADALLFVGCPSGGEARLRDALRRSAFASRIYVTVSGRWCRISEREMAELRAVSDPRYEDTLFVDAGTAEARRGSRVRVVRGPFAGLEGRLVRYRNRSYVVLTVTSLGVLVHVPKWYCRAAE